MSMPVHPKIYHITHVENLPRILVAGGLWSDAAVKRDGVPVQGIGIGQIKHRRLTTPVPCLPGLHVGDFVPFYFCPRSVMLYFLGCANHPNLTYRGGQTPIVHLECDLRAVLRWARSEQVRWDFSLGNAGANFVEFSNDPKGLPHLDWEAIHSRDFRSPETKDGKQAEFLVHDHFPWSLVERIGVMNAGIRSQTLLAVGSASHSPPVELRQDWYF